MVILGYPRLYLCKAAKVFKEKIKLPIYQVDEVSLGDFISYYQTLPLLKDPLIIEDIAYLSYSNQSDLLKFIEDSKQKIILLSSEDNIIPTILSRMSLVYKFKEEVKSSFLSPSQAEEELSEIDKDTYYESYVKKEMELSPIRYYYDQLLRFKPNKQKLLRLLENE